MIKYYPADSKSHGLRLLGVFNCKRKFCAFLGGEVKVSQIELQLDGAEIVGIKGDVVPVVVSRSLNAAVLERAAEVVCPSPLSGGFGTFTL